MKAIYLTKTVTVLAYNRKTTATIKLPDNSIIDVPADTLFRNKNCKSKLRFNLFMLPRNPNVKFTRQQAASSKKKALKKANAHSYHFSLYRDEQITGWEYDSDTECYIKSLWVRNKKAMQQKINGYWNNPGYEEYVLYEKGTYR